MGHRSKCKMENEKQDSPTILATCLAAPESPIHALVIWENYMQDLRLLNFWYDFQGKIFIMQMLTFSPT